MLRRKFLQLLGTRAAEAIPFKPIVNRVVPAQTAVVVGGCFSLLEK